MLQGQRPGQSLAGGLGSGVLGELGLESGGAGLWRRGRRRAGGPEVPPQLHAALDVQRSHLSDPAASNAGGL